MNYKIKSELIDFIDKFKSFLPKDDIESIRELVDAGEYKVAFENLCTQLYEYEIKVEPATVKELDNIGTKMKLNKSLWLDLLST
ncbi:MAG: MafI family immunity protein [Deltaproteobacteria bacterium]|nr:MafI family immunity protein [Deltaproteobacteria bacterium]